MISEGVKKTIPTKVEHVRDGTKAPCSQCGSLGRVSVDERMKLVKEESNKLKRFYTNEIKLYSEALKRDNEKLVTAMLGMVSVIADLERMCASKWGNEKAIEEKFTKISNFLHTLELETDGRFRKKQGATKEIQEINPDKDGKGSGDNGSQQQQQESDSLQASQEQAVHLPLHEQE